MKKIMMMQKTFFYFNHDKVIEFVKKYEKLEKNLNNEPKNNEDKNNEDKNNIKTIKFRYPKGKRNYLSLKKIDDNKKVNKLFRPRLKLK